jgi:hypothetical protein
LHIVHHHLTHGVTCESCKSQGPHCRRVEDAVLEWNQTSKRLQQARVMNEHFLSQNKLRRDRQATHTPYAAATDKEN